MPYDAVFDATKVTPRQGGGAHPVGNKFPFRITGTKVSPTKNAGGGLFEVEFTSDVGSITNRYNLWNPSEQAVRIANEQFSALCHAVGVFQVDFKNDGAALLNARGLMDVGHQKGQEPSAENPAGGYVELKKVYRSDGSDPTTQQASGGSGNGAGSGFQTGGTGQAQNQTNPQQGQNFAPQGGGNFGGQGQPNPGNNVPQNWGGQQNPSQGQGQTNSNDQQQQGGWSQGQGQQSAPWGAR